MKSSLNTKGANTCQAGSHHISDYFAGVCDGKNNRATAECLCSGHKAMGTLSVSVLPVNPDGTHTQFNLGHTTKTEADNFMQELRDNADKGWTRLVATNTIGSSIAIQIKDVYTAHFSIDG